MTVADIMRQLALEPICTGDLERKVRGGYCGDLLSWVMGRAKADDAWITIMSNVNSVAVAVLADVACIILADSSAFDEDAAKRAQEQEVTVLRSDKSQFELCCALGELLKQ